MSSNQLIYFLVLILLRCKLSFNASFWVIHSIRNEIRPHSSLQEQYTFWIFYIISFTKSHKMFYENAPHFLAWDPFYGWNRNRGKMENPNPKKIFFRFTFLFSEKIGARKIKNTKKLFCWTCKLYEQRRGGFLCQQFLINPNTCALVLG